MITLGDISILDTVHRWKVKKEVDNTILNYFSGQGKTALSLEKGLQELQMSGEHQKKLEAALELAKRTVDEKNNSSTILRYPYSQITNIEVAKQFTGSILPISLEPKDAIWGNWRGSTLNDITFALTTYTIEGTRSYQNSPYTTEFREMKEDMIERIERGLPYFYEQIERLQSAYPQAHLFPYPCGLDLFRTNKMEKIENLSSQLPFILDYFDAKETLVFGSLTDSKKQEIKDTESRLRKGFLNAISDYITPEESTHCNEKVLARFKIGA